MKHDHIFGSIAALLIASSTTASRVPIDRRSPESVVLRDTSDTNSDSNCGAIPKGKTVTYDFNITEIDNWKGPDGVTKKKVMLVNGQLPGPTITANFGDTIVVNVNNYLPNNGTSIHWHGVKQQGTNVHDGVNGITECPLGPGKSRSYEFLASEYGTSWYHSHYSVQYADGIWGPIVVKAPEGNYDIDLGAYPISDHYYDQADNILLQTMHVAQPPASDNILFNGTNINPANPSEGAYSRVKLTPGKSHLLRLINPSVENTYQVSIVNHDMTVVSTDFVPVQPVTTNNLFLGVGQRADVLINATQAVGNYWLNVTMFTTSRCGASKNPYPAAIIQYEGASSTTLPTSQGVQPTNLKCQDSIEYVPTCSITAPLENWAAPESNMLNVSGTSTSSVVWKVDSSSLDVSWEKPILLSILNGTNTFPADRNVKSIEGKDSWSIWVVENADPVPHPMHIHGHNFMVLGTSAPGDGSFDLASNKTSLNGNNPTRRDVTMLPASGWTVLAFRADNPGAWLFHCHIAWHVSGGLGNIFVERASEQAALVSNLQQTGLEDQCSGWKSWYETATYQKVGSGLR